VQVPYTVPVTTYQQRQKQVTENVTRHDTVQVPYSVPVTIYEQRQKQVARQVPVTRQIMVPVTVPAASTVPAGAPKASPQASLERKTLAR
jgi:hypothetical protein